MCATQRPQSQADLIVMCSLRSMNSILNHIETPVALLTDCRELEAPVDPEPTDYGERYKERPVDHSIEGVDEVDASDDTVKVYCLEGTPLSDASSLTDLNLSINTFYEELNASSCDHSVVFANRTNNTPEDNSNINTKRLMVPLNTKLMPSLSLKQTPLECDHNDSDDISRSNDIISVNSNIGSDKCVIFDTYSVHDSVSDECVVVSDMQRAVSVTDVLCCAVETPLMFSRNSSLESLSSCGVKCLCCESSVVSEFSLRASEVVSPSDLPDSPFDSLPPVLEQSLDNVNAKPIAKHEVKIEKCVINNNNDDNSMSVRLSSLSISNDVTLEFDEKTSEVLFNNSNDINNHNTDAAIGNDMEGGVCSKSIDVSSEDENEEELLAHCISLGMKKQLDDKANNKGKCVQQQRQQNQSDCSDDDDERVLLQRCIESGMMSNASNNAKYRKNAALKLFTV